MSGKPWTPERCAAHAERMRSRWSDPDYRAKQSKSRKAVAADPAWRAKKSALMSDLNRRMKSDASVKAANAAGRYRSFFDGSRSAALAARMSETMRRPDLRSRAAEHCRSIGSSENSRRGWKTRRLNKLRAKVERARS
jgi:hypothetical protein